MLPIIIVSGSYYSIEDHYLARNSFMDKYLLDARVEEG